MGASEKTKFRWNKLGRIFAPDGRYEWMHSHAQNPSVLPFEDRLRVYFNCRPKKDSSGNFTSYPTFVDLDIDDPRKVIHVHDRPLLSLGDLGTFDQFGVMAGSVLPVGNEIWLYYVGWSRCLGVPYHHALGLAVSKDGGTTFSRFGTGPILTRSANEPFIQNSPFVWRKDDLFHMWYSSGIRWVRHDAGVESIYVVMHATSMDGVRWERNGIPCVPTLVEHECQTSPTVLQIGDRFHMWFCYRCGVDFRNAERGYRIGYAWSDDLVSWHREDALGDIPPSAEGWDSQMMCYPCVLEANGRVLMFYSGNDFGRDGFGCAVLENQAPSV